MLQFEVCDAKRVPSYEQSAGLHIYILYIPLVLARQPCFLSSKSFQIFNKYLNLFTHMSLAFGPAIWSLKSLTKKTGMQLRSVRSPAHSCGWVINLKGLGFFVFCFFLQNYPKRALNPCKRFEVKLAIAEDSDVKFQCW
jgi:ethanolamine transporter EutH